MISKTHSAFRKSIVHAFFQVQKFMVCSICIHMIVFTHSTVEAEYTKYE